MKNRQESVHPRQEEVVELVETILKERGSPALETAKMVILQEKIDCKELSEALKYFITEYWSDLGRPTLLSLICEAVGGDPTITDSIAVPMILISGGIDIHDDIIDQSPTKRSTPTVLGKFGKDIALLVGDALLFKGLALLNQAIERQVPPEKTADVYTLVQKMFFELGTAEALELKFRRRSLVSSEEYLEVVRKKAADVEAYTRISAIIGGGSAEDVEALGNYGRILGMVSILTDDLMDMADFEEAVHRFMNEPLPLPLIFALEDPKKKNMITPLLMKEKITEEDAKQILAITEEDDGLQPFQKLLNGMRKEAKSILNPFRNKRILGLFVDALIPTGLN